MADPELHKTRTEARAGSTPHIVRYILAISTGLLILAYIVILAV
jgi:hypothetical protein